MAGTVTGADEESVASSGRWVSGETFVMVGLATVTIRKKNKNKFSTRDQEYQFPMIDCRGLFDTAIVDWSLRGQVNAKYCQKAESK